MVDQRLALHLIILVQAALLSSAFNSSNDGSHDSGCAGYSRAFAENVGEVITCIANHTSPMSYCGSCQRLLNRLHHIVTDNISASQDGVLCAELVLPVSELMVGYDNLIYYGSFCINLSNKYCSPLSYFQPTYNALKFIIDIWDSSSCSKCLTDPVYFDLKFLLPSSSSTIDLHHFYENLVKGAKRFDVSAYPSEPTAYNNLTQRFFQLLDKTITCFNLYINYSASSLLDSFNFPGVDLIEVNSSVCHECYPEYGNLSEFYFKYFLNEHFSLKAKENTRIGICADVINTFNRTHWAWKYLLCRNSRRTDPKRFFATMPLITLLAITLFFYTYLKYAWRPPVKLSILRPKQMGLRRLLAFNSVNELNAPNANEYDLMASGERPLTSY